MSWRYSYSTLWPLPGRSALCPSCASKQKRLVSSAREDLVTSQLRNSGNAAPSHSRQAQEIRGESPPVRIKKYHPHPRQSKAIKNRVHGGPHKLKHFDQPAARDGNTNPRAVDTQLYRWVPATPSGHAPTLKFYPPGSGPSNRVAERYPLGSQSKSVRAQEGPKYTTMGGGGLNLTLSSWDRQRQFAYNSSQRAFASLAAGSSAKLATLRVFQRATAHHRSLYRTSSTSHWVTVHQAKTEPRGHGRRLFSFRTSCREPAEALHIAQSSNPKPPNSIPNNTHRKSNIMGRLRSWQEQHRYDPVEMFAELPDSGQPGEVQNLLTRPSVGDHLMETDGTYSDDDFNSMKAASHGRLVDFEPNGPFLRPGDLSELGGGGGTREPILAIHIRDFETQSQFYTMQGKWIHRLPRTIRFSVPGFLDRTSVDELLPYLPPNEVSEELADKMQNFDSSVPREVGSSIVRKMLDFWNASDVAYRKHATQLDNVHDLVALETESRFVVLSEVAARVFGTPSNGRLHPYPTLYAVHRALIQKDFEFLADTKAHRLTSVFEVLPKSDVRLINKVGDWIRDYQELIVASADSSTAPSASSKSPKAYPIIDFVNKARRLITESRRTRTARASDGVGPSLVKLDPQATEAHSLFQAVPSELFSEADKSIIRFLEAWACSRIFNTHSVVNSLGSMVLRAIGSYNDRELQRNTCFLCLQEIGVLAPWENPVVFERELALPGHAVSTHLNDLHRKTIEPETRLALRALKDTMQDFRHDWGNLEVFCIDGEDAKEIDDGLSVERVAGRPSQNWLHVHIANPSAFIDPDHFISSYASHLAQTIYLPERTYPMLPKAWTQARLSLAPNRPVLTFSARMNGEGEILETKVTSGIIRKVTYITPSTARQHLRAQLVPDPITVITVGGQMPKRHTRDIQSTLSRAQIEQLQILQAIGDARDKVRRRKGSLIFNISSPDVSVYGGPYGMPVRLPTRGRSHFYEGDPIIQIRTKPLNLMTAYTDTDAFVASLMILAGEVAAQWCQERNLPVIYRYTLPPPDLQDPLTFVRDHIWPSQDQYGTTPLSIGLRYLKLAGRSRASTVPMPHQTLGVERYTKATSPLRRYGDLVVHWQIEAALRQEARTGATEVGKHEKAYLPFSKDMIDSLIPGIELRERRARTAEGTSKRHWVAQLLFRAFYFKEAILPDTYEMFIMFKVNHSAGQHVAEGMLKEPAIKVEMSSSVLTETLGVEIGDWWEVKLLRIETYSRRLVFEPVRLISKEDRNAGGIGEI
ncbi:MAG: hypothetical protein M1812_008047 [Candelaria pacifica]|nr:MAG: hypothetical protein M1812_008047 [Candelaria pacifica]